MDEKPDDKKEEKPGNGGRVLDVSAALNLAAYPSAGAAGFYAFKQDVRKNSVEFHTKGGNFDNVTAKMLSQIKEARESGGPPYGNTMQEAMGNIRARYEEVKTQKFQKWGYKNVLHNWRDIADNNKMESITVGFTAAAITLGALLMAINSKDIFKPLFKKEGEDQDKGPTK